MPRGIYDRTKSKPRTLKKAVRPKSAKSTPSKKPKSPIEQPAAKPKTTLTVVVELHTFDLNMVNEIKNDIENLSQHHEGCIVASMSIAGVPSAFEL